MTAGMAGAATMTDNVDAVAECHFKKLREHVWVWEDWKNLQGVLRAWWRHRKHRRWRTLRKLYSEDAYKPRLQKLDVQVITVISPTRALADYLKHMLPACEADRLKLIPGSQDDLKLQELWKGRVLKAMNLGYRIVSLLILLILALVGDQVPWFAWLPFVWYGFSRANEVAYAFGRDALRIARRDPPSSDLRHDERIKLALWSYASLLIDFAIMYFVLRNGFDLKLVGNESINPVGSVWSAIYFSGVTMVTLGYGDITPGTFWLRGLALYQVACGIALLVLSFALYVGEEPEKMRQASSRDRGATS